ncbi:helix-turn-helix domain-containing protein [Risungbinella massiliensis]|uniref:helix-turn-helix domain-containing protein n=1 Tax=Risungbinella massiliensis TaxID=1329796 RepID=UPI0005CBD5BE|nr:tetratricopeptide repeat protein [Risungbinella massiliensis]
MYHYITKEMGEVLKKARLEQNMSQESLSDDNISTGTISNLERGLCKASPKKLKHLLGKLNLNYENFITLEKKVNDLVEIDLETELLMIEQVLNTKPDQAWKRLQLLDDNHPWVCTFKGRACVLKRLWEKAISFFLKAIDIAKNNDKYKADNLLSLCYYELSRAAYYQNKVEQALELIETGITKFDHNGKRSYIYYHLLTSRIIYLRKQGKTMEAYKCLDDLKDQRAQIEFTSVSLSLINLEAELLNDLGQYQDAIKQLLHGLELARIETKPDKSFELFCTLGTSYLHLKQWLKAEGWFNEALYLKDEVRDDLVILPYRKLGELYFQVNKMEDSLRSYQEAKQLCSKVDDMFSYCEICLELGDIFHSKGDEKKAIDYYDEAIEVSSKHQFYKLQLQASLNYLKFGTKRNTPKYQKIIDSLSSILLSCGQKEVIPMTTLNLGMYETDPPNP